jgi:glucan 1,3-beta-glucosidase
MAFGTDVRRAGAWKAENADDWSYQAGLKYGWIPWNPTDYKYPGICG